MPSKKNESKLKEKYSNDDNYVLIFKSLIYDKYVYNLIESKNKYIFKYVDLPSKFTQLL
jgi:hypothetical protein